MSIFNELDHRLSVVKRWGVLHTIQTQSVAEHCFNVQRIAMHIAREWFDVTDRNMLLDVAEWAHHHDDFEALSHDIPTMVKPYFDEDAFESEHADLIIPRRPANEGVRKIVKLADMLEGFHFLAIEMKLGNKYVENHYNNYLSEMYTFVENNYDSSLWVSLKGLCLNTVIEMGNETSTRHSRRGR